MRQPLVEWVGFEPTVPEGTTDFESCSHLALSCLLWSVAAVLETVKTLVLQRFSDIPAGIDQLYIRKNQSSNSNEKCSKTTSFLHAGKKIRKEKTLVRYGFAGGLPDKCNKNRLKTNHTKHPFGPKHRKESSL